MEEIDTVEESRENKARIEIAMDKLETRWAAAEPAGPSPEEFREKCQNTLAVLKSNTPMDEKSAVSHSIIERVEPDTAKKRLQLHFSDNIADVRIDDNTPRNSEAKPYIVNGLISQLTTHVTKRPFGFFPTSFTLWKSTLIIIG